MYVPHYPYKSKMRKTVSILPGTSSPSFALERDLKERGEAERRANRGMLSVSRSMKYKNPTWR